MRPSEKSAFFSLDVRRRIEAEKVRARRASQAQATRVVARLACERRNREVQTVVAEVELSALRKQSGGSLQTLWSLARSIITRLRNEDRPATLAAADEVAQAIEGEHSRGEQAPAVEMANGTGARPEGEEVK